MILRGVEGLRGCWAIAVTVDIRKNAIRSLSVEAESSGPAWRATSREKGELSSVEFVRQRLNARVEMLFLGVVRDSAPRTRLGLAENASGKDRGFLGEERASLSRIAAQNESWSVFSSLLPQFDSTLFDTTSHALLESWRVCQAEQTAQTSPLRANYPPRPRLSPTSTRAAATG